MLLARMRRSISNRSNSRTASRAIWKACALGISNWKYGAKPLVAQPKPSPEEHGDVDGKERVGKKRVSDTDVRRDGTAEVASPEDDPQHRGPRNQVRDQADQLNDPRPKTTLSG